MKLDSSGILIGHRTSGARGTLRIAQILAGAFVLLLAACSQGPTSFMGQDNSAGAPTVIFLRWTEAGGQLSGQFQTYSVSAEGRDDSQSAAFTGLRNGQQVNLTFSQLGMSRSIAGTLNSDSLSLQVPDQRTGRMNAVVLKAASIEDYNKTTEAVRRQVASAEAAKSAPLNGTWVSEGDGWAKFASTLFVHSFSFRSDRTYTAVVRDGSSYYEVTRELTVSGRYSVDAARLTIVVPPFNSGRSTYPESRFNYEFSVKGDILNLQQTDMPTVRGKFKRQP